MTSTRPLSAATVDAFITALLPVSISDHAPDSWRPTEDGVQQRRQIRLLAPFDGITAVHDCGQPQHTTASLLPAAAAVRFLPSLDPRVFFLLDLFLRFVRESEKHGTAYATERAADEVGNTFRVAMLGQSVAAAGGIAIGAGIGSARGTAGGVGGVVGGSSSFLAGAPASSTPVGTTQMEPELEPFDDASQEMQPEPGATPFEDARARATPFEDVVIIEDTSSEEEGGPPAKIAKREPPREPPEAARPAADGRLSTGFTLFADVVSRGGGPGPAATSSFQGSASSSAQVQQASSGSHAGRSSSGAHAPPQGRSGLGLFDDLLNGRPPTGTIIASQAQHSIQRGALRNPGRYPQPKAGARRPRGRSKEEEEKKQNLLDKLESELIRECKRDNEERRNCRAERGLPPIQPLPGSSTIVVDGIIADGSDDEILDYDSQEPGAFAALLGSRAASSSAASSSAATVPRGRTAARAEHADNIASAASSTAEEDIYQPVSSFASTAATPGGFDNGDDIEGNDENDSDAPSVSSAEEVPLPYANWLPHEPIEIDQSRCLGPVFKTPNGVGIECHYGTGFMVPQKGSIKFSCFSTRAPATTLTT